MCHQTSHLPVNNFPIYLSPSSSIINLLVCLSSIFLSASHQPSHLAVINLFICLSVIHLFTYLSSTFPSASHQPSHLPIINLATCLSSCCVSVDVHRGARHGHSTSASRKTKKETTDAARILSHVFQPVDRRKEQVLVLSTFTGRPEEVKDRAAGVTHRRRETTSRIGRSEEGQHSADA